MTNKELIEIIEIQGTATRALIKAEIDRVHEMDVIRNGRITKNEENIEILKKDTSFFRTLHRNPKWSILLAILLVAAVALGTNRINVKKTIEGVSKIELKDVPEL